ncbi:MAG: SGNH/GDSL hydrolase family protein [Myxococcota bacterium]|nr:SGNH/GDSL hydrolase family protein [Myxococcota bacterium]
MALSLGRRLAYSGVMALCLLGLAEGVARAVYTPSAPPEAVGTGMVPHPTRIWGLQPGVNQSFGITVTVNELGMREPVASAPDGAPRILTLGDSSIYGHGVPDGLTLHDQLQSELSARGVIAEVLCGGVPGYSILQTRVFMDEVGWDLAPDLLVVANQFSDMAPETFRDSVVLQSLSSPTVRLDRTLQSLALYGLLRQRIARAKGVPEFAAVGWPEPNKTGQARLSPEEYKGGIEGLLLEAHARGVGVVMLRLPERRAYEQGFQTPYGVGMMELGEAWGVPVLAVDEEYRRSGLSAEALYLDNVHPTDRGHALIAQGLAQGLVDHGFPEQVPVPAAEPTKEVIILPQQASGASISPVFELFLGAPGGTPAAPRAQ